MSNFFAARALALTFSLAALLAGPQLATAQVTPQIAKENATRSNSTFLLGFYPTASKTQSLYLPADLTGAAAGNIASLYFMYGSTGNTTGTTLSDLTIKLGQTASTGFSGTSFFPDPTFVTVLNNPSYTIAPGVSGEWFSIPLTAPFTYDPTQTLILQITFTGSTSTNFGTFGSANNGKKLYANTPTDLTGSLSSGTWQHFGFDLGNTTGVATDAPAAALLCFPNPATTALTVVVPRAEAPADVTLTDALGRVVRRVSVPATALRAGEVLNVRDLPAGPYVLTVLQGTRRLSRRVSVAL